jgi:hypothetical protein
MGVIRENFGRVGHPAWIKHIGDFLADTVVRRGEFAEDRAGLLKAGAGLKQARLFAAYSFVNSWAPKRFLRAMNPLTRPIASFLFLKSGMACSSAKDRSKLSTVSNGLGPSIIM